LNLSYRNNFLIENIISTYYDNYQIGDLYLLIIEWKKMERKAEVKQGEPFASTFGFDVRASIYCCQK
jgi:hypothetical protein